METSLSLALMLRNVIPSPLLPSLEISLAECVHQCYYSPTCATIFYDFRNNTCYASENLCSITSQKLTSSNGTNCFEWKHASCAYSWSYHKPSRKCLQLSTNTLEYKDARLACEQRQSRVVNIYNSVENNIVKNIARESGINIYIGLKEDSGTRSWHNGTALGGFKDWDKSQPSLGFCTITSYVTGKWRSVKCPPTKKYLCEKVLNKPSQYCDI